MDWWKETIFLEIDQSIEVFRRTDERMNRRRNRRLDGPLHWRTVVRYVTAIRTMKIYDEPPAPPSSCLHNRASRVDPIRALRHE
jgi:hypothetical protein